MKNKKENSFRRRILSGFVSKGAPSIEGLQCDSPLKGGVAWSGFA